MCKTNICTNSPDRDSSTGESTSTSTSARSSNSDGEVWEEVDDDKAMQAKTPEDPLKKAVKHNAEKKWEASPNRREMDKGKKTDEQESLIELLQGQQEMMMKAEDWDCLAIQELMKFEMEAEKEAPRFHPRCFKEARKYF